MSWKIPHCGNAKRPFSLATGISGSAEYGLAGRRVSEKGDALSGAPLETVSKQVAAVHAEFLLVHPFREGKGRLARWLADLIFLQACYPMPLYNFSGKGSVKRKKAYLNAVIAGYGQDYSPLTLFFRECVEARLLEFEE
jgi:fido (protein-threonine AMPylation protein)